MLAADVTLRLKNDDMQLLWGRSSISKGNLDSKSRLMLMGLHKLKLELLGFTP